MTDKKIRLISLDIETTGLDPTRHVPLSIGAVDLASGKDYFVGLEWDELVVNTAAMRINRIDITRSDQDVREGVSGSGSSGVYETFRTSRPGRTLPAEQAIDEFGMWLCEVRRWGSDAEIRALGKNPASLDLPLLRPTWDNFWKRMELFPRFPFSHRCVDLNSVFVAIAAAQGKCTADVRSLVTELAWNDLHKSAPQANINGSEILPGRDAHYAPLDTWRALDEATSGSPEHHALADAWWNAYAWQRCVLMLRGES